MIKVVNVVEKKGTALDRLAKSATPFMNNVDYQIVDVHPKRPDISQLNRFEELAKEADVIDYMYYRTADMLRSKYDWLKNKPSILTHHNPYAIKERDWNDYDIVVACNKEIYKNLSEITTSRIEHIPITVDTDFWQFNTEWTPNNRVIMVANRIESKKGILPVAKACKKIGAKFLLVGNISDSEYFHEVISVGGVEYAQNVTDSELRDLYYKSSVHVCNSIDNFESGTMPVLEAMLCGVPVLSRLIGHVPELNNGENMVIQESETEDVDAIANYLKEMIDNPEKLKDIRDKAWQTAKTRSNERRAYMYNKLYRSVLFPNQVPVTVITPVSGKPEITEQNIEAVANQTYKNIEHIIINDGEEDQPKAKTPFSRHLNSFNNDYGLARARNIGAIEATGEILIFCDQRIIMQPDAVENLVNNIKPSTWLYGIKNDIKKEFVENFSAIYRSEFIKRGMFNERINMYGGMSQEIRNRLRAVGGRTERVDSAKATQVGKSSNRNRRRQEIIRAKTMLWKMGLE